MGRPARLLIGLGLVGLAAASAAGFGVPLSSSSLSRQPARSSMPSWVRPRTAAVPMLLRRRGGGKQPDGEEELRRLIEREDADIACVYRAEDDAGGGEEPTPQWTVLEEEDGEDEEATAAATATPLEERPACIVIDPFSPFLGKRLKRQALRRGLACVDVLCPYTSVNLGPGTRRWRTPTAGREAEWAAQMPFKRIAFVLSESDVGTATAERLQAALGAKGNGINPARRSKYLTNLALQARGAASTRQLLTGDWAAEAEPFLAQLQQEQRAAVAAASPSLGEDQGAAEPGPFAVVKPQRGAASGDVYVCKTIEEAKAAFEAILGAPTYGGGVNDVVLVQEFLAGPEYAVDTVSSDGETKVIAVWKYDKRRANGAPCVYFGTMLEAAAPGSEARRVADYVVQEVLPALGVNWGPTHTEVIMAPAAGRAGVLPGEATAPLIVECNCRWHLCNFVPVLDACLGFNSVDVTLDAFVGPEAFAAVPAMPEKVREGIRDVAWLGLPWHACVLCLNQPLASCPPTTLPPHSSRPTAASCTSSASARAA